LKMRDKIIRLGRDRQRHNRAGMLSFGWPALRVTSEIRFSM
jgi:hypothetical protein